MSKLRAERGPDWVPSWGMVSEKRFLQETARDWGKRGREYCLKTKEFGKWVELYIGALKYRMAGFGLGEDMADETRRELTVFARELVARKKRENGG